jgi:hypothetical protein
MHLRLGSARAPSDRPNRMGGRRVNSRAIEAAPTGNRFACRIPFRKLRLPTRYFAFRICSFLRFIHSAVVALSLTLFAGSHCAADALLPTWAGA